LMLSWGRGRWLFWFGFRLIRLKRRFWSARLNAQFAELMLEGAHKFEIIVGEAVIADRVHNGVADAV